jgi:hypothetical protein
MDAQADMNAALQNLTDAVNSATDAMANEGQAILTAQKARDDAAVETAVGNINTLATQLKGAVANLAPAVQTAAAGGAPASDPATSSTSANPDTSGLAAGEDAPGNTPAPAPAASVATDDNVSSGAAPASSDTGSGS